MRITVTTQPEPLVTLDEAKTALGESGSDRDELITGLIAAAQAELDGPKSWVGTAVAIQSVEVRFDRFFDCLRLPGVTVHDPIAAITYLDDGGAEQTLDVSVYRLLSDGRVVLAKDQSWPSTLPAEEAVTVAYDLGIDDPEDPRVGQMETAILMHVKMTLDMDDVDTRRKAIEALVQPLRAVLV